MEISKFETCENSQTKIWWGLKNDYIYQQIKMGQGHEHKIMNLLKPLFHTFNHVIDIGAHIGTWTVTMSPHIKGKVYSFEPQTELYKCLQLNVQENKCGGNVFLHNMALLHKSGNFHMSTKWEYNFMLHESNTTRNTKTPQNFVNYGAISIGTEGEPCRTCTLDYIFENHSPLDPIDFIKIDAECSEYLVIQGAKTLLTTHHPAILFEYRDFQAPFAVQWNEILKETNSEHDGYFYPNIFGVLLRECGYTNIKQVDETMYYCWYHKHHQIPGK